MTKEIDIDVAGKVSYKLSNDRKYFCVSFVIKLYPCNNVVLGNKN